jgi:predicted nucleotidyltransferase
VILVPDTINLKLASLKEKLAGFGKRNHILKLSLFGSALTRDFSDDSHIDLVVQFKPCRNMKSHDLIREKHMIEATDEAIRWLRVRTGAAYVISSEPCDERSFPAALGEITGV